MVWFVVGFVIAESGRALPFLFFEAISAPASCIRDGGEALVLARAQLGEELRFLLAKIPRKYYTISVPFSLKEEHDALTFRAYRAFKKVGLSGDNLVEVTAEFMCSVREKQSRKEEIDFEATVREMKIPIGRTSRLIQ